MAYASERTLVLDTNGWRYSRTNGWGTVFMPVGNECAVKLEQVRRFAFAELRLQCF